MSTNGLKRQLEDWSHIKWKKINKLVKNLRQRIFRARKLGNFKTLRSLQKLMQRSYANLLLSVRRITQTNKGKATAGIDKEIINTPEQRVVLVNNWSGGNQKPTKRVEIPKANGKKRPFQVARLRGMSLTFKAAYAGLARPSLNIYLKGLLALQKSNFLALSNSHFFSWNEKKPHIRPVGRCGMNFWVMTIDP